MNRIFLFFFILMGSSCFLDAMLQEADVSEGRPFERPVLKRQTSREWPEYFKDKSRKTSRRPSDSGGGPCPIDPPKKGRR